MRTERIQLVKPNLDLVEDIQSALIESQKEFEKYFAWLPNALEAPEENMQAAIENHKIFSNELRYIILDNDTSRLLGTCCLLIRDPNVPFFEIGYWVRTSSAGKGYISEAISLLETYAFSELGAKRLEIRMAKCNTKSKAVAERAGYHFEGALKCERRLPGGELTDTLVFGKIVE